MAWKDHLDDDLQTLLDEDEFAEEITWYPLGVVGNARTFSALVDRNPIGTWDADGNVLTHDVELVVPYSTDASKGVATVTKGSDTALVALRERGTPVLVRIVEILTQDQGGWTVRAEK